VKELGQKAREYVLCDRTYKTEIKRWREAVASV
jgi:hypothetical protein